ncbi:MAG TPA: HAD hydrolase-like protein [Chloroflexota bacterium]
MGAAAATPVNRIASAVFLFDVDGTLLQAGNPYHHQAMVAAVAEVCGTMPDVDQVALAGRTDTEILKEMVARAGASLEPETLPRLFKASINEFERLCPADLTDQVITGVVPALEALFEADALMGLVTGNIEQIAWRKLAAAGLRRFFRFGAFGDESGRRADLPPLAVSRAGRSFQRQDSFVIGDTPLDIDCGLACGMRTIAVATGRYSIDQLRECQPYFACRDLPEFVAAVGDGRL